MLGSEGDDIDRVTGINGMKPRRRRQQLDKKEWW